MSSTVKRGVGLVGAGYISEFHIAALRRISGVEIVGKWFQTSVENVPAEGSEVHSSTIKLDEKTATEGRSRVALFLPATTPIKPDLSCPVYAVAHLKPALNRPSTYCPIGHWASDQSSRVTLARRAFFPPSDRST